MHVKLALPGMNKQRMWIKMQRSGVKKLPVHLTLFLVLSMLRRINTNTAAITSNTWQVCL